MANDLLEEAVKNRKNKAQDEGDGRPAKKPRALMDSESCGYCCDAVKGSRGKIKIDLFHNCESNFYLYISPEPTFKDVRFLYFDGEIERIIYFETCPVPAEFETIKKLYEGIKHLIKKQAFYEDFRRATAQPHRYFMLDMHPLTADHLRFRANVLPDDPSPRSKYYVLEDEEE
ncbi:hypothetical protein AC249_AIPGENE11729 [Exaiptasia diaphana]|nr:hypothetical protein AC249_AIPGENE11729 [Exaiptasia diaphana]